MATSVSVAQTGRDRQDELRCFRRLVYGCLSARSDALFELIDGVCCPVPVDGIAHVTLAPCSRRGHGSAYAAIADGGLDEEKIRDLLAGHRDLAWPPDFVVDTSTWPRPEAMCSPGRGFYHQQHAKAQQAAAGRPVVLGWNFSWLAALTPAADSWTAPLDVVCRNVADNHNTVAIGQITGLLSRLDVTATQPLFTFDAGYDPVTLTTELSAIDIQIVVRLRSNRVFFTRPPIPPARRGKPGRPKRHGTRFHCAHPASWPSPDLTYRHHDHRYGNIDIHAWQQMHPERQTLYRDPDGKPSIVEGTIIRLNVQRLPSRRPDGGTLWLWWAGPADTLPDLDRIWRAYLRRFDIEHTFRFAKQHLGWTTPKIRTPQQAQHWTWLIAIAYTQLRLARHLVADHRLPWQQPLPAHKMTPGRVRQGFSHLLPQLGTPAKKPKNSRPGPGRPKGRKSTPATRHPARKIADVKTATDGHTP